MRDTSIASRGVHEFGLSLRAPGPRALANSSTNLVVELSDNALSKWGRRAPEPLPIVRRDLVARQKLRPTTPVVEMTIAERTGGNECWVYDSTRAARRRWYARGDSSTS